MYADIMLFILLILCVYALYCLFIMQDELEKEHRRAERYKRVLEEVSKDAAKERY